MRIYPHPIIFFDLDDSLINQDANTLWIRWRAKHERWAIIEGILALTSLYRAYKKGTVTHARLSSYYRTRTHKLTPAEYQQRVDNFFAETGQLHIYPQAASLLFAYQQQGSEIVMITGADDIVAKAYAKELGIKEVISNSIEIKDNQILGLKKPLCYGAGKVALAEKLLISRGLTFKDCAFYTDSHADLPLLEKVAQPIVLNPNTELATIARQKGWPCLDWRDSK